MNGKRLVIDASVALKWRLRDFEAQKRRDERNMLFGNIISKMAIAVVIVLLLGLLHKFFTFVAVFIMVVGFIFWVYQRSVLDKMDKNL